MKFTHKKDHTAEIETGEIIVNQAEIVTENGKENEHQAWIQEIETGIEDISYKIPIRDLEIHMEEVFQKVIFLYT